MKISADELSCYLRLLGRSLDLLEILLAGGNPSLEQQYMFWQAVSDLERYVDFLNIRNSTSRLSTVTEALDRASGGEGSFTVVEGSFDLDT